MPFKIQFEEKPGEEKPYRVTVRIPTPVENHVVFEYLFTKFDKAHACLFEYLGEHKSHPERLYFFHKEKLEAYEKNLELPFPGN